MRFGRIRLQNFKCYEEAELRLDSGVTVIHGLNGSGKSSLLEACFFALYGSKALDTTLDEVVTLGAEETIVELWFTHAGESYHVRRRIRVSNGDARTAECVLEGPGGVTEGATDVRNRVVSLLRMDSEAFVNCAYVRQGEVNKLINASPATRQDMLDDLLQLGTLEEYRERASDARVGIGRVRDDKRGALSEVETQLEEKEAQNLHERHSALETKLGELKSKVERYESNREEAEETRENAVSVIDEYEEKQKELANIEEDIETLRERIQETEREREQLVTRAGECQERLTEARTQRRELLDAVSLDDETNESTIESDSDSDTTLADRVSEQIETFRTEIDDITETIRELSVTKAEHDNEVSRFTDQADDLESTAETKRERASELEETVRESREVLETKREQLAEIGAEIEKKRATFEDSPVEFGEAEEHREEVSQALADIQQKRTALQTDLTNERERLVEAQALLEEGKCPECGQPVEESPHVTGIDEQQEHIEELESELESLEAREREHEEKLDTAKELVERESTVEKLDSDRKNLRQLLDEREQALEEKASQRAKLLEEADECEENARENRAAAERASEKADETKQNIADCNRQKAEQQRQLQTLETLAGVLDEIDSLEEKRETLTSQREEKTEVNDERRERLAEKRTRRSELQETVDEGQLEQAREQKRRAEEYLEQVEETLSELEAKRGELQGKRGAVANEIAAMRELRERRESLTETVENLESLYTEAERLEEMYGTLRAELRQQNIENLERMLNETFELVYENDTYSRLEIDGEYRLTVYQKDGEELDPEQLSGGERALFNLSLRCAIYQLLAEGIEGTAPMPPLILDEPTVFLDSGHVSQLVELIGKMYDLGVEQILVVSHDDELVAAADDLVTVTKDPITNRSTVERRDRIDARAVELEAE